ncbi:MAG: outer membrane lipoprotein chaperone LolA [Francisellaceae bacterium]
MKIKKVILFACCSALMILEPATTMAQEHQNTQQSVDPTLFDKLVAYDNIQAKFKQRLVNPAQNINQLSQGQMWVTKPSYFKWQIDSPNEQLLLSNGNKLWNYDKELQQVTIQNVPRKVSDAPYLLLLTGDKETLNALFNVEKLDDNSYRLTPKNGDQALISYVDIRFAGNTLDKITIGTETGQKTIVTFYDETHAKIPLATYNFIIPKGVDVLGE